MEAPETLTALQKIAAAQTVPVPRFNTELVRSAWDAVQRRRREARRAAMRSAQDLGDYAPVAEEEDPYYHGWIKQLWTDHIIVCAGGDDGKAARISYTVEAPGTEASHVRFGKPEPVRVAFVAASRGTEALGQVLALASSGAPPWVKEKGKTGAPPAKGKPGTPPAKGKSDTPPAKGKGESSPAKGKDATAASLPSIKTLADLNSAIQSYGRAEEEDRARLKAHLLREARRLGAPDQVIARVQALGKSQVVKATMTGEEALGAIELARRTRANHGGFETL